MNRRFALLLTGTALALGAWWVLEMRAADRETRPAPAGDAAPTAEANPGTAVAAKGQDDEADDTLLAKFMRQKLAASNQILEGLCVENFDLITKGAVKLETLSKAERWRISNDAMYRQHSAEFRRVAERIGERAKEKDLEGAALAWLEATMSCIECHRFVRGMKLAGENAALDVDGLFGDEADDRLNLVRQRIEETPR